MGGAYSEGGRVYVAIRSDNEGADRINYERVSMLQAEMHSLDQQRATLLSEKDSDIQQRARSEYNQRLAEYTRQLSAYERRREAAVDGTR